MQVKFNPKYNIAYIKIRDKEGPVASLKLSEEVVVDIAEDGKIYGFELLNANEQLSQKFIFTNEQTGEEQQFLLSA